MAFHRASDFQWTAWETLISSLWLQVEMGTQSNIVRTTTTICDGTDHGAGYVGWDPTLNSVVVAHQGTNPICCKRRIKLIHTHIHD